MAIPTTPVEALQWALNRIPAVDRGDYWDAAYGIMQGMQTSKLLNVDGFGMHVVQFATEADEIAAVRAELVRLASGGIAPQQTMIVGEQPSEHPAPRGALPVEAPSQKELWARMDAIDPNWRYGDAYTGARVAMQALGSAGVALPGEGQKQ